MRVEYPLLDLSFFRRRRFSGGAGTLGLTALALAGIMFGLTQYLQFVQGYTPLETGIRFLPLAAGLMFGARCSEMVQRRVGTTRVVVGGLVLLAATTPLMLLWQAQTAYWLLGVVFAAMGLGIGTVIAPATDAVMGAIPEGSAGIGSAMNSVVRMVGASLGIAIIGSIMFSTYASRVTEAVAGLPVELAEAAKDSVGAAVGVAASLPGEAGQALFSAAGEAFADALGIVGIWSASIAVIAALLVAKFMPSRDEPIAEEGAAPTETTLPAPAPATAETEPG
jgi:Na+/melibiose symporter-like transporter